SKLVCRLVERSLSQDPRFHIVGQAADVFEARDLLIKLNPDMLVLDIHMPKMNGDEFLKRLMAQYPTPVVVFSAAVNRDPNLKRVLVGHGAVDVVPKPDLERGQTYAKSLYQLSEALFNGWARLKAQGHKRRQGLPRSVSPVPAPKQHKPQPQPKQTPSRLIGGTLPIAIGASTGGTDALVEVLPRFPAHTPGVLVVQHMLDWATEAFVKRLNRLSQMEVRMARNGDTITPGRILIAPGDQHMAVRRGSNGQASFVRVYKDAPVSGHCPSVDVLFKSVATHFRSKAIGALLTGMGEDGARGMLAMRKAGARTLAQDEETCVVYGMPRAAWELGGAERRVPLNQVAPSILDLLENFGRKSA
ncbi:MAG: chemotaxis-specific protein-glutamate methyltransferase CheB, partial [Myxococcota bacterium]